MRLSAEQRRAALAEAAVRVITRDGVGAASVRAIASEAGMSLASVHYVYASRDELLRAAMSLVIEGERAAAGSPLEALPEERELEPLLRAGITAYLDLVRSDPAREQGMLELTQHALRNPELTDLARDQYAQYFALVGGLLGRAAERARVRWTVPVDVLSRWVIAFTDGLTLQWLAAPDEAAAAAQVDLFVEALARHPEPAIESHPPADTQE